MNDGWGYLLLFGILASPLVFWLWNLTAKTMKKDTYKDEFDKEQEKMDYWCAL
jgi:hypothetical protein